MYIYNYMGSFNRKHTEQLYQIAYCKWFSLNTYIQTDNYTLHLFKLWKLIDEMIVINMCS